MPRQLLILILALWPAATLAFGENRTGLFLEQPKPPVSAIPSTAPVEKNPPVVLGADEMGYDQENGIVVARGNVEVEQGAYLVVADQITYFQKRDTVVAEGNVSMVQPTGDVIFSDRAVLNNALKTGVIDAFKARMADNSVLVASRAVRTSPSSTTMTKAEYTPCNLCPGKSPFWQLNADEVKLDQIDERVTYENVSLDIHGVPILYTPYLSHPTPDAQAKSGFLAPQYASNNNLGVYVKAPYYWRIDHDQEFTITPWYSSSEGPVLEGDYRQLTDNGEYSIRGSATYPERIDALGNTIGGNEFRGHLFAKGYEATGDYSRVGFDIQRASDDTFLRRYGLGDQRALFSRLYAETAEGRSFGLAQGISIQGLRLTDSSRTTPWVVPAFQGYYETDPDANGIRYHLAGDAQMLSRDVGVDQNRVSATVGATLPYVTGGGHVFTTTLNLRQDMYRSENVPAIGGGDADTYRVLPQAAMEWRYPLVSNMGGGEAATIEPVVLAVMQANGGNPLEISNEDSTLLELTDTNLFSINRMPGLDAVDGGNRIAYGARGQYLFSDGTAIDALLGQNYNPGETPFPNSTTPGEEFSDYIGRLALNLSPVRLVYRFALDKNSLGFNRNELSLLFSRPWLSLATSYRSVNQNTFLNSSEEGQLNATLPLSENWSIYGGARRNFSTDSWVTTSSGVVFKNECFNIGFEAARLFTRDRDVEPTTQYMLRVAFKNLGEFGGD